MCITVTTMVAVGGCAAAPPAVEAPPPKGSSEWAANVVRALLKKDGAREDRVVRVEPWDTPTQQQGQHWWVLCHRPAQPGLVGVVPNAMDFAYVIAPDGSVAKFFGAR